MICASDDRTCAQLKEYIQKGADSLLLRLYSRTIGKDECVPVPEKTKQGNSRRDVGKAPKGKKPRAKNAKLGLKKRRTSLTLTQMVGQQKEAEVGQMGSSGDEGEQDEKQEVKDDDDDVVLNLTSDSYYGVLQEPMTVIHPLKGCSDPYSLTRVLKEVEPMFVVLYDAELSFVRQLEVYKASRPGKPLRYYNVHIFSISFNINGKILGLIC